jgi:uncharacterized protein YndB with AHSA1/START domain
MPDQARVAPVRTSVNVEVSCEHAFAVFTERIDAWWPRSHHVGDVPLAEVRLEPREGGRWYEIRVDGTHGDWGTVLTWDPPARLVLGWQLDGSFSFKPNFVTEVEVTFTAEGPHRTHVVLEHRNLERYGDRSDEIRRSIGSDGGWPQILSSFASLTAASTAPPNGTRPA